MFAILAHLYHQWQAQIYVYQFKRRADWLIDLSWHRSSNFFNAINVRFRIWLNLRLTTNETSNRSLLFINISKYIFVRLDYVPRKWLNELPYEIHKVCNRRRSKSFYERGASRLCLDFREALYCSLINNPQLLFLLAILGDYTRRSASEHIHIFFILLFKDSPCDVENAVAQRASEFFAKCCSPFTVNIFLFPQSN